MKIPQDQVDAQQGAVVRRPGRISLAVVSLVLSLIATILTWVSAYGAPRAARAAAEAGDYANIYTFLIVSVGVIATLNVIALGAGISAARQKIGPLFAGAGIALSATGLAGVAINLIVSFVLPPSF